AVGGAHRRVDGVARAERLAAALAGAMARGQRIRAVAARLDVALALVDEAIADGQRALLIELEFLDLVHRAPSVSFSMRPFSSCLRMASAAGPARRALPRRWISRATTRSL